MVLVNEQHSIKYASMKIVSSKFIHCHQTESLIVVRVIRIALKCLDYKDKTFLMNSVSGFVALEYNSYKKKNRMTM
jgi:hypothetical protein